MKKLILFFLCLPILLFGQTWTYTEATNIAEVTGGTSGSPEFFSDFVTADRAGTATELLAATAGLSNPDNTLDFAVRPVEDLAILIKCIVAAKTAEADFIFITGTDWRGAAQTEALDVTAGNGTYTTTKYFATISGLDCSDNNAGGGTVWADGTIQVTQDVWGVIWDYGNNQYRVDCLIAFGDGSTSTYFASEEEMVVFTVDINSSSRPPFNVKAAATLRIGELTSSQPSKGSYWQAHELNAQASFIINEDSDTAIIEIFGSIFDLAGNTDSGKEFNGVTKIERSLLYTTATSGWQFAKTASEFNHAYLRDGTLYWSANPAVLNDVTHDNQSFGGIGNQTTGLTLTVNKPIVTNPQNTAFNYRCASVDGILQIVDPSLAPTQATSTIGQASGIIRLQHTINIHVVDKDGVDLQSVGVLCEDDADADIFDVTTDANGDITEQTIIAIDWTGTSETEDDNSPFKFTFSKTGYQTLILNNITVDSPIVWHLELQKASTLFQGRRRTF